VTVKYLLVALSLLAACTRQPPPADDERPQPPPEGWFVSGSAAAQFLATTDPRVAHSGRASARLVAIRPNVDGAGTLMQSIAADAYRGQRVRLSAFVRTERVSGWTGLWMRVDRPAGRVAFDNMQGRAIHGTTDWAKHEIVLDVADDAVAIRFGLLQDGPGASHIDDVALEIVDAVVPVTGIEHAERPVERASTPDQAERDPALANGDFESADPRLGPWFMSGEGQRHYRAALDRKVKHGGNASARLKPLVGKPSGYGVLIQVIPAERHRGRRVRVRAAIKTVDANGDFWTRIQAASSPADGGGLAGSVQLLTGTSDWRTYELVIDVPPGGDEIQIGAGLRGRGTLWLDDVYLEAVGSDVALTSDTWARQGLQNGDFEAGSEDVLEGWFMSGRASVEFEAAIDRTEHSSGAASARLRPRVRRPSGYGTLMQVILADSVRGKRLRMTAQVKGEDITGRGDLWLRVQAPYSPVDGPGLGGGSCKLSRSFAWKRCEITFDVPDAAQSIQLGVGLAGPGVIWLDQVELTEVSLDVPATSAVRARTQPVNLDFEAAIPR
jgi:hypothetical protein